MIVKQHAAIRETKAGQGAHTHLYTPIIEPEARAYL